ncbi:MAG: hypothetical protein IPQ07_37515 [Myxococcales bacterium]|nr:hypothetical protein [Myxococcales bacterium]
MKRLWIATLLVACDGGAAKPPAKPAAPAMSCTKAADGMVSLLVANKDPKPPDEATDKLRKLIRERCEQDAWSFEAQRCFGDMKTIDDANVCGTLISDDQQAALIKAQDAATGAKPQ